MVALNKQTPLQIVNPSRVFPSKELRLELDPLVPLDSAVPATPEQFLSAPLDSTLTPDEIFPLVLHDQCCGAGAGSFRQGFGAGLFWGGSGSGIFYPEPAPAPGQREHDFGIFEN